MSSQKAQVSAGKHQETKMRVFVTGATGFVGEAVVHELLNAGHSVLGLARNDAAVDKLTRWGVEAHRGDLLDSDSLAAGAHVCDGVIHTGFIHDFSAFAASVETDRRAVETLVKALEGSGKPFVSTSGIGLLAAGHMITEADAPVPGVFRAESEHIVLAAAAQGQRTSVVRLPPSVHGVGDHGFVPALIDIARRKGFSAFIGDGSRRWPAVHRLDAARLYRLALEQAPAGTCLHAVAEEEGVPLSAIAATIGVHLGIPIRDVTEEEAPEHFEWMAHFVKLINHRASSTFTRNLLGWRPREQELLTDMQENYFS